MDEFLNCYRQRLDYTVGKVSPCPYCGLPRIVIKHFDPIYSGSDKTTYEIEHVDEEKAVEAGCFTMFYAFDSVEEAIEKADAGKAFKSIVEDKASRIEELRGENRSLRRACGKGDAMIDVLQERSDEAVELLKELSGLISWGERPADDALIGKLGEFGIHVDDPGETVVKAGTTSTQFAIDLAKQGKLDEAIMRCMSDVDRY